MKNAILVRRAVAPMDSGASASLLPANAEADAVLTKIPLGEILAVKLDRSRSNPQNRLYWGIISHLVKAGTGGYETNRALHKALLVKLGYYDVIRLPDGKGLVEANSTAFDAMSADEFQIYMDAAIRLICSHPKLLPGTNSDDLINEVRAMLGDTMIADIPSEDLAEAQLFIPPAPPDMLSRLNPYEPATERLKQQRKIEPNIPVQDAEPHRRGGAEQSAHIRRPGPADPAHPAPGESHPHSEFGSPKSSTASERVERRDAPQESTLGWASTVVGTSESRSLSQTPPIVPNDTPPLADVIYPLPANIVPQKLPGGGFDWNGYAEAMIEAIPHADAAEIRRAKVSRYLGLLRTTKSGDLLWGQVMQAITGRLQDLDRTK